MVGTSGGEFGIRGFVRRSIRHGKELWRTYTIPAPGEPGNETWMGDQWKTGGAPIWVTGKLRSRNQPSYWGTGNGSRRSATSVRATTSTSRPRSRLM